MIDEVKKIIEEEYEIKVKSVEKIKNVFKIKDENNRFYSLKVIKYEFAHFKFIIGAMKHLQENGYDGIPEFILTRDKKEFIKFQGKFAYLNPWIQGRESNYDNFVDVSNATKNLAIVHNKSKSFIVTPDMKPRYYWGEWVKNFTTRKNEILDFKNRISRKENMSEFDHKYEEIMEDELLKCDEAIRDLEKSDYFKFMKDEEKQAGFCHHDYANHNILVDENNKIFLIDFDYCILDTHLHDLSSLIIRKMKDGKWCVKDAEKIISIYNEFYKVQKSEIEIMAGFMEFPQAYWQLGIQYYWEKQPWGEEFFLKKLKRISLDNDERQEFVEEFRCMGVV